MAKFQKLRKLKFSVIIVLLLLTPIEISAKTFFWDNHCTNSSRIYSSLDVSTSYDYTDTQF